MSDSRRLKLTFLQRALAQFDLALAELQAEPDRRANRDSVALHYQIVWELVFQAIKRYLEMESPKADEVPSLSFQTMVRRADALGILRTGWPGFGEFREARNAIAHMYDEARASLIIKTAPHFAEEARFLLGILTKRLGNEGS
jgi:hypothetical protein